MSFHIMAIVSLTERTIISGAYREDHLKGLSEKDDHLKGLLLVCSNKPLDHLDKLRQISPEPGHKTMHRPENCKSENE